MIFVDTNILIDIFERSGRWHRWSAETLADSRVETVCVVNAVIIAELSPRFPDLPRLLAFLDGLGLGSIDLGGDAAFRAGQAHRDYRRQGGRREAILADFLIGAHAAVLDAALLTRDRARFMTYFSELTLITPETDHG